MKTRDEKEFKGVLNDLVKGASISQVAKKYGIAEITIYKYLQDAQDRNLIKKQPSMEYVKKGKW
jgi:transposase